jgi:hypothetical protein
LSDASDLPDLDDQCSRLQREATARAVLVVTPEGNLAGHSAGARGLRDEVVDAVGDLAAALLSRPEAPAGDAEEDLVAESGGLQLCAAAVGGASTLAALVVAFDAGTTLQTVRARMKRAREQMARSLEAR